MTTTLEAVMATKNPLADLPKDLSSEETAILEAAAEQVRAAREQRERREKAAGRIKELKAQIAPLQAEIDQLEALVSDKPQRQRRSSSATGTRAPRGQNDYLVLKALADRPGVSAGQLANATKLDNPTVATKLNSLAKKGQVNARKDAGRVYYTITDEGQVRITELAERFG